MFQGLGVWGFEGLRVVWCLCVPGFEGCVVSVFSSFLSDPLHLLLLDVSVARSDLSVLTLPCFVELLSGQSGGLVRV